MDNEEIRELLKELKETSDESSAVKSRVVKIHFDTRREAAEREKAKRKAQEEAEKLRRKQEQEEAAKKEALEEEAEKKAAAVVNEAKAQAAAVFSPDLGSDIGKLESQERSEEEEEPETVDLNLNWDPRKTPGLGRYLGALEDDDQEDEEDPSGREEAESDREDEEGQEGQGPFGRIFGNIRKGTDSFMKKLARTDSGEEGSEEASEEASEEISEEAFGETSEEEEDSRDDRSSTRRRMPSDDEEERTNAYEKGDLPPLDDEEDLSAHTAGKAEMKEIHVPGPSSGKDRKEEDDWKKRMEQPPRFNLRHVKIPDMPVRKWIRPADKEEDTASREDTASKEDSVLKADTASKADSVLKADSASREDSVSRAASVSKTTSAFVDDFESDAAEFSSSPADQPEGRVRRKNMPGAGSGRVRRKNVPDAGQDSGTKKGADTAATDLAVAEAVAEAVAANPAAADPAAANMAAAGTAVVEAAAANMAAAANPATANMAAAGTAGVNPAATGHGPAENQQPQSIEVVNLNENANNRQVEVISLDKNQTGPLPNLSGAESSRHKKPASGLKERLMSGLRKRKPKEKSAEKQASIAEILRQHGPAAGNEAAEGSDSHRKKKLAALILLILGTVLAVLLIIWAFGTGKFGSASSSGSGVTADDGLTVRIKEQPMSYTTEGDVTLSIRAAKTIQSITVDGEAAKFEGDRKTDITVHAVKSSLKLMVVSTDKVRSATVKLMYVDSQAPVITVSKSGGMVTLSAKDDLSGVKGIYYGTCGPLSDVPLYQEYSQPFKEDENTVYYWYAVDNAGNSTAPVSGSFTEASSMSFEQDSYTVYPNSTTVLHMKVKPAGAYLSGLTFTSSDESVMKIDQENVMVPVSEGSCKVTAEADGVDPVTADVSVSDAKKITISAIGDLTLGTDPAIAPENSFVAYQNMYGNTYFFENVRDILSSDDVTFGNFEGTLTESDERANKKFTFKGDPSWADILTDGSVDVVTLANNHSEDYGDQGLSDTEDNLDKAGVDWCTGDQIAYKDINGVRCAFIGIYAVENGLESLDQVKSTVAEAKDKGASLTVVYFHWNSELVEAPNDDMLTLGHAAVDAGADLVVGSHSHLVSGIEKYQGRYIVYGLSNFCFGGNIYPKSYDSMIFRQTFTVDGDGTKDDDQIEIIPVLISSISGINDFQPTPAEGEDADRIMQEINDRSAQFGETWDQYRTDGTKASASEEASGTDADTAA